MIVIPYRMGFRVDEIPIDYRERVGTTTLNRWQSTVWTFKRLWNARKVILSRADGEGSGRRP